MEWLLWIALAIIVGVLGALIGAAVVFGGFLQVWFKVWNDGAPRDDR
jgi:hypothetical protein